jgi:hypothetical protein
MVIDLVLDFTLSSVLEPRLSRKDSSVHTAHFEKSVGYWSGEQ